MLSSYGNVNHYQNQKWTAHAQNKTSQDCRLTRSHEALDINTQSQLSQNQSSQSDLSQCLLAQDDNPYAEKLRAIHRDILRKLGPTSSARSRHGWQRTAKYASLGRLYSNGSMNTNTKIEQVILSQRMRQTNRFGDDRSVTQLQRQRSPNPTQPDQSVESSYRDAYERLNLSRAKRVVPAHSPNPCNSHQKANTIGTNQVSLTSKSIASSSPQQPTSRQLQKPVLQSQDRHSIELGRPTPKLLPPLRTRNQPDLNFQTAASRLHHQPQPSILVVNSGHHRTTEHVRRSQLLAKSTVDATGDGALMVEENEIVIEDERAKSVEAGGGARDEERDKVFMEQVAKDLIKRIQIRIESEGTEDNNECSKSDNQLVNIQEENEDLLALTGVANRILRQMKRKHKTEVIKSCRHKRRLAKSHRDRQFLEQKTQSPYLNFEDGGDLRQKQTTLEQHITMQRRQLENFRAEYESTRNQLYRAKMTSYDQLHSKVQETDHQIKRQKQLNEALKSKQLQIYNKTQKMTEKPTGKDPNSLTRELADMENRLHIARNMVRFKSEQTENRLVSIQKMSEKIESLMYEEDYLVVEGDKLGLDFTTGAVEEPVTLDELIEQDRVKEYFEQKQMELVKTKQAITQLKLDQMNSEFEQKEKISLIVCAKEDKIQQVLKSELRYLDSEQAVHVFDNLLTKDVETIGAPQQMFCHPTSTSTHHRQPNQVDTLKSIVRKRMKKQSENRHMAQMAGAAAH